ncbi:hypothetical protein [Chryseobacterium sp. G0201]|uniref:hypothetical protein n=1 Tax=Chryseobacterium sp. G0201 TaxID=2487065 RepID=UPI000F4E26E1|nr:hypothetical protein [Chryseobacterium sp. G0201]AZA53929.1 hypothetical protein EG348_13420 [Chryseobacterium sp. G0201]
MDFIQYLQIWTKADINQGRWMIGIAVLIILPICIMLIKTGNSFQKGMLIPLGLLFLIDVGYGGYLLYSKPKSMEKTKKSFQLNSEITFDNEVLKVKVDHKSYTMTKYIWAGLLILSIGCFFILKKEYLQGLALGFAVIFLGMLLIDAFLHQNLKLYLSNFVK